MSYVMVPVPEEHVDEVHRLVARLQREAAIQPWDAAAVAQVIADTDDISRALLEVVAQAASRGSAIPQDEAAAALGLSRYEVIGILRDLNTLALKGNHRMFVLAGSRTEPGPDGTTVDREILSMELDIAEMVAQATQPQPDAT